MKTELLLKSLRKDFLFFISFPLSNVNICFTEMIKIKKEIKTISLVTSKIRLKYFKFNYWRMGYDKK